jgi:uncharacterized NAD(P)/FAD-binding protein YdhS
MNMDKPYTIHQFPINKNIDKNLLSLDQMVIRSKSKGFISYGPEMRCSRCGNLLPLSEFYIRNKITGLRSRQCRDCLMAVSGILNIGLRRFYNKIKEKGIQWCNKCKKFKPLNEFSKNKNFKNNHSPFCKTCQEKYAKKYRKRHKAQMSEYSHQYYLNNKKVKLTS